MSSKRKAKAGKRRRRAQASDSSTSPPAALFINRELSLLEFNARVLAQAQDATVPLLERVRFIAICSTNLDEFFEIRVAGAKQLVEHNITRSQPDGMSATETLKQIAERTRTLVEDQYRVVNDQLLPELEQQGIFLHRRRALSKEQQSWIKRYFKNEVLPVLTPVGLDPAHPFPRIVNKSLNFIVNVEGKDAFGRSSGIAIVQVPRSLPRLIALPVEEDSKHHFVMLSSVIHAHIGDIFPGMKVTGCHQFRVTRDSDLWVDEEEIDDLMRAVQGELPQRKFGDAVRLEVADDCSEEMANFLLNKFQLGPDDLYDCAGPVNLNRLAVMHDLVDRPDLKFPPHIPRNPIPEQSDMFEVLRRGDVFLHHPFDSFAPVIELIRQAAHDPDVLAIKQTLYRAGKDSPIVEALIEASRSGKEVTVLVELRARFDEEENISLANRLTEAGAKVGYGVVGYKTHAKMLMVVRREGRRMQRYIHLGTGNYHHNTTKAYTDLALMTCDRELGEDVHRLFFQLTGLGRVRRLKKIVQSPFDLHKKLLALIDDEAVRARQGETARIIARMNSLSEREVIAKLYEASQAGVKIDLLVRGICCLRPGVAGVSENIRVRSVVGRFLEHSRVFYFHAGGDELTWCASADWMSRNLLRRVETCFPIDDPAMKARVRRESLDVYLKDNCQAWTLGPDGQYARITPGAAAPRSAQMILLESRRASPEGQLEPKRLDPPHLGVQRGAGQGVVVKPSRRKGERDRGAASDDTDDTGGESPRAATPTQPNGEA